jgi:hypothetical protein
VGTPIFRNGVRGFHVITATKAEVVNWRQWFKSTYMLSLEAEVLRLRTELAKWQDAALLSKGLPPVSKPEPGPMVPMKQRLTPSQFRRKYEELSARPIDAKN